LRAQLVHLVQLVLSWYNLVASSAAGGVPFCDQQRSLTVDSYIGRQCHACCEQTCLRVTMPPSKYTGSLGEGGGAHGAHTRWASPKGTGGVGGRVCRGGGGGGCCTWGSHHIYRRASLPGCSVTVQHMHRTALAAAPGVRTTLWQIGSGPSPQCVCPH
jgi:hypothetical protein